MRVSLNREILLTETFSKLFEKYGNDFLDWYFRPSITEYGIPTFVYIQKKFDEKRFKEIENEIFSLKQKLINPPKASSIQKENYYTILEKALLRKGIRKPETLHEEYALVRYEVLKVILGGLGWSVLPEYKKKWKITHEMFGAYFNTNGSFSSIFPELEGNGTQFGTVVPKKGNHYLVNPPFEKYYIKWTCERLQEWINDDTLKDVKFTVIIPVWDIESRKKLKLKTEYGDIPELSKILKSKFVTEHNMTQMKFWDSVENKIQHQKSYIHKIIIEK